MNNTTRPMLWTTNFILVFISNLLLFVSFYMLVPVLPFYLKETFNMSGSVAGVVLSLYVISALIIRPFSGFMVDMFRRKPLYLICYGLFCATFAGYVFATTIVLFIMLRIFHGFTFGISTVSGSTLALDVMPSERRGEGIGYFGMAVNIAMAVGPIAGLWLYNSYSFDHVFIAAFLSSLVGIITIILIKSEIKNHTATHTSKQPLSLDRFILVKTLPCVVFIFIVGLGYGSVLNYVGLYSQTAPFESSAGLFFTMLSIGIISVRILSARSLNQGRIVSMITTGGIFLILSFALFAFCSNAVMLYAVAFLLGIGFGYITPAFQTMLINMAEHHQRGTANATYFTFWDLGIGLGTVLGGMVIEKLSFVWLYSLCAVVIVMGIIYFVSVSAPWFQKYKLR